ncbi:hypothetical protein [Geminocystis sp. GBBB08]|uniref:hypothetical protein n=1 Tax=Geminocystis sp. GBBB08 TaxID=2604140 RepID=UPI0027E26319|nr:hypothetical protein [Geminocystis sp. GBBB08]MBL1210482.1 hypothetical protein [Geminocystis sp. GBBB08]
MSAQSLSNSELLDEIRHRQQNDSHFAEQLKRAVLGEIELYIRDLITKILEHQQIKWASSKIDQATSWVMEQLKKLFRN